MPTFNDVAPSEWLKASHFKQGEEKTLTIAGWMRDKIQDRKTGKEKPTVSLLFKETESKLGIVNKANEDALNKIFGLGYDLDSLAGNKITLFVILVKQDDNGEPTYGIRIKPTNGNGNGHTPHFTIDNLKAIREQLRGLGITPRTLKDTEIATPAGLDGVYNEHAAILTAKMTETI